MRKKLFIGMPVFQSMNPETQHTLENLIFHTKEFEVLPPYILYNQSCIPFARNTIIEHFLASGAEYCFMLDADISIQNPNQFNALDLMYKLMDEKGAGIVCGVYPVKNPPFHAACLTFERQKNPLIYEDFSGGGELEIKYAATGFMLVSRDAVLAAGEKPFNLLDNPDQPGVQMPEDYSFCERVRQHNWQIWACLDFELCHTGKYFFSMRDNATLAKSFSVKPGKNFPDMEISRHA